MHAIPDAIASEIEIASPALPRVNQAVKLVFEVADVESLLARLESLGVQTMRRSWQEAGKACDAMDPEGNIFQPTAPKEIE